MSTTESIAENAAPSSPTKPLDSVYVTLVEASAIRRFSTEDLRQSGKRARKGSTARKNATTLRRSDALNSAVDHDSSSISRI